MNEECRLYEMLEAAGLMGTCGLVDLGGDAWTLEAARLPAEVPDDVRRRLEAPVPAAVPGHVHLDLHRAGVIDDPLTGDGAVRAAWIGRADWRYRRTFELRESLGGDAVDLVCLGLDAIAELRLDGRHVGTAASMHVPSRVRLGSQLAAGRHELEVTFRGPVAWAERELAARGARPAASGPVAAHVRTMAASTGGDGMPPVAGCGIWRPIRLHAWSGSRIAALRPLVTRADAEEAVVRVVADLEHAGDDEDRRRLGLVVRLVDPDGRAVAHGTATASAPSAAADASAAGGDPGAAPPATGSVDGTAAPAVRAAAAAATSTAPTASPTDGRPRTIQAVVPLERPRLWWPRGLGEPHRYRLDVTLVDLDGELPLDAACARIGLRSVRLDADEDADGSACTLLVNEVPVACRGAGWTPAGPFPATVPAALVRRRVRQAAEAGMNMLRVRAIGTYEQDAFYEACDAAGILVWQDVMRAEATWPEEPPLPQLLEAEVRHQVARLARHPSVALWCGGERNLLGRRNGGWADETAADLTWGRRYLEDWLPRWVRETDPTRPFLPDSPWSGAPDRDPADPDHGDCHVRTLDIAALQAVVPRFCSEIGFPGPPTRETLAEAIGPAHLRFGDPRLECRRAAIAAVAAEHAAALRQHLGDEAADALAGDFDAWHEAALDLQARALHLACDWLVRRRPRCMGILVRQLHDAWAADSWSLIDAAGREKPAYHAVARVFRAMEEQRAAPAGLAPGAAGGTGGEPAPGPAEAPAPAEAGDEPTVR